MTQILGHDIDGKPLRAGDQVVYVGPEDEIHLRDKSLAQSVHVVLGPAEEWAKRDGATFVRLVGERGLHARCEVLRRLDDRTDHQPADAEFTSWLRGMGAGKPGVADA